ncbi:MAG: PTS glucose transporter subunit IIA [Clostridia bacterium]|nr:PTS glucose transporter subunit IIA [Clostridia bacterium]
MNHWLTMFKKKPLHLTAPMNGATVPMEQISDEAFQSGVLGYCVAIQPENGNVYAPGDGKIESVFATRHAINLILENGAEVLIHMGLETVNLKGKHFSVFKKDGDKVKQGELIARMDLEEIAKAGYSTLTPVVLCNSKEYAQVTPTTKEIVSHGDVLMELKK